MDSILKQLRQLLQDEENYIPTRDEERQEDFRSGLRSGLRIAIDMFQPQNEAQAVSDEDFIRREMKAVIAIEGYDVGDAPALDAMWEEIVIKTAQRLLSAQPAVQVPQDAALQFADHIINGAFDGGDWNGGDLQDLAADYGLLKLEEMAAPCSEEEQGCRCARDGADFPVCCFRKTYRLPTPTANPSEGAGE